MLAALIATLVTALVFWLWPGIDIAVARWFYIDGAFFGASSGARAFRYFFYHMPNGVLALYALGWGLGQAGVTWRWLPAVSHRGLLFLALSMAIGPGLIVNLGLKDHMHRPRPVQIAEFGGPMDFKPYWRADGGCSTNCSFVSGEVSSNAWLIAPASLAPPPLRAPAMAAALVATVLTALGRMAFGGHFLSDTLFAAFLTFLVVQILYRIIRPADGTKS